MVKSVYSEQADCIETSDKLKQISHNIKVVELSHSPLKVRKARDHHQDSEDQDAKIQKYLKMTSFIDELFRKKDTQNPVY